MYNKISPDKILADLRRRGIKPYEVIDLDLNTVRDDELITLNGKVFQVIYSDLDNPLIQVKFNDNTNSAIPFTLYQRMKTPFEKVYITNLAQAGTIKILTAQEFEYVSDLDFFLRKKVDTSSLVPYSGATQNVDLGSYYIKSGGLYSPYHGSLSGALTFSIPSGSWFAWKIYLNEFMRLSGSGLEVERGGYVKTTGKITGGSFAVDAADGIDATIPIPPIAPLTVPGSATFTKGILTAYTPPS